MRIDVHTHIIPEKIPDFSKKFGYEGFVSLANKKGKSADMMVFEKNFEQSVVIVGLPNHDFQIRHQIQ